MNKLNRRPSFVAMTYDAKRPLNFLSDIKALINISRAPSNEEFKPKSLDLLVSQEALSHGIGGSL